MVPTHVCGLPLLCRASWTSSARRSSRPTDDAGSIQRFVASAVEFGVARMLITFAGAQQKLPVQQRQVQRLE